MATNDQQSFNFTDMQFTNCVAWNQNPGSAHIGGGGTALPYTTTPNIQITGPFIQQDFEKVALQNELALLREEVKVLRAELDHARKYQIRDELADILKGLEP